ncbi:MAG TPA: TIGR03118 family protein [Terriglobales bacterium]|nr:TIGR03118 family protein [Terriglobales bacterium]
MLTASFPRVFAVYLLCCVCTFSAFAQHFTRTDLTADVASTSPAAPNLDPNLVNPWGMSRSSTSPWWISDNGTGLTSLYDGTGAPLGSFIVPGLNGAASSPTGTVYNFTSGFEITPGHKAAFIFVTEDGTISAWNGGPSATIMRDRSKVAIYKGCALALKNGTPFLYATNFKSGRVEVFDTTFTPVGTLGDFFVLGLLPRNYAPFGIQNVGGNLVVTYAHRAPGSKDEDHGPGLGYVAIFSPQGQLLGVLQHGSYFNAPWGIAMAPGDFGTFSHRLLIGNFGDGTINAFNAVSGQFEGTLLMNGSNSPLAIHGLWGLSFGNEAKAGSALSLYFTAGPNDENNGILGTITPVSSEQRGNGE